MKTHWKRLVNYDYLGAYSLDEGKDKVLTIKEIKNGDVVSDGGRRETCMICYWQEEEKPMILNKINSKTITLLHGTPYVEDWVGKKVQLFADTTKLKGEVVECLRIRPKLATKELLTPTHKQWEKAIQYVVDGGEIVNITSKFNIDESFTNEVQKRKTK